jgi:hypothetical protein
MNLVKFKALVFALSFATLLGLASCESDKNTASSEGSTDIQRTTLIEKGEAGGVIEDQFTVSAAVTAIDASSRQITLTGDGGKAVTFKAPAEVRNFDQVHVGDRVNASIQERMVVFVSSNRPGAAVSRAEALAVAPEGAKPGVMTAEAFEIVGKITSIELGPRRATIQFPGGQTRTVTARSDVYLSRYKVGDSVVIQVSQTLWVLVAKP